jgi:hypothetical protein
MIQCLPHDAVAAHLHVVEQYVRAHAALGQVVLCMATVELWHKHPTHGDTIQLAGYFCLGGLVATW